MKQPKSSATSTEGILNRKNGKFSKTRVNTGVVDRVKEKYPPGYSIAIDFENGVTLRRNQYPTLIDSLPSDVLRQIPKLKNNFDYLHLDNFGAILQAKSGAQPGVALSHQEGYHGKWIPGLLPRRQRHGD